MSDTPTSKLTLPDWPYEPSSATSWITWQMEVTIDDAVRVKLQDICNHSTPEQALTRVQRWFPEQFNSWAAGRTNPHPYENFFRLLASECFRTVIDKVNLNPIYLLLKEGIWEVSQTSLQSGTLEYVFFQLLSESITSNEARYSFLQLQTESGDMANWLSVRFAEYAEMDEIRRKNRPITRIAKEILEACFANINWEEVLSLV